MENLKIDPNEFYLLEEVKLYLEKLSINPYFVESLYIVDYDSMQKLIKGIHIQNLIQEKHNQETINKKDETL